MTTLGIAAGCKTCGVTNDEHVIKTTGYSFSYVLLVKGTAHEEAEEVVFERFEDMPLNAGPCDIEADLNAWLLEDRDIPFPQGTLIWWQRGA